MVKQKRSSAENNPNPIDLHVGKRMRLRRGMLKMSQDTLASLVGVTFQQIQKYESGSNRMSASRLYMIGQSLGVSMAFFFEGVEALSLGTFSAPETAAIAVAENGATADANDPMKRTETLQLVTAFWNIMDTTTRTKMLDLIISLAGTGIKRNED